jgi:hypothetical protein
VRFLGFGLARALHEPLGRLQAATGPEGIAAGRRAASEALARLAAEVERGRTTAATLAEAGRHPSASRPPLRLPPARQRHVSFPATRGGDGMSRGETGAAVPQPQPRLRRPPQTAAELLLETRRWAEGFFDATATAHVAGLDSQRHEQWKALGGASIAGSVDVATREMNLGPGVIADLNRMFEQPATSAGRHELIRSMTAVAVTLHEVLHDIGPNSRALVVADWQAYLRYPHTHAAAEGTVQLATELFLDDLCRHLRLEEIDPGLTFAALKGHALCYGEATRAMDVTTKGVSALVGQSQRELVAGMVRAGGGEVPLVHLVRRLISATGLDGLEPRHGNTTLRELHAAMDGPLGEIGMTIEAGAPFFRSRHGIDAGHRMLAGIYEALGAGQRRLVGAAGRPFSRRPDAGREL